MKLEGNGISRYFWIKHKGKEYHVDYTESDYQTLALLNRTNWEITLYGEELQTCEFKDDTEKQKAKAKRNRELQEKIIEHCMQNFMPYILNLVTVIHCPFCGNKMEKENKLKSRNHVYKCYACKRTMEFIEALIDTKESEKKRLQKKC